MAGWKKLTPPPHSRVNPALDLRVRQGGAGARSPWGERALGVLCRIRTIPPRAIAPRTTAPRTIAPRGQLPPGRFDCPPRTTAPRTIAPRGQLPPGRLPPEDNCPPDDCPPRTTAPRKIAPEDNCPPDDCPPPQDKYVWEVMVKKGGQQFYDFLFFTLPVLNKTKFPFDLKCTNTISNNFIFCPDSFFFCKIFLKLRTFLKFEYLPENQVLCPWKSMTVI